VLAVGRGAHTHQGVLLAVEVQKGDVVVFPRKAGVEVSVRGEKMRVLAEAEVLAVLEEAVS
jgi:co-chaperonin GroES (HSP10)